MHLAAAPWGCTHANGTRSVQSHAVRKHTLQMRHPLLTILCALTSETQSESFTHFAGFGALLASQI